MRIKIGQIVNTDEDVNLSELKPLDKIIAAATNAYHNTSMYRRRFAESEEKQQEQMRKIRETLIDNLLSVVAKQLDENELLKEKGDSCVAVLVEVPARFRTHLVEVISAHEFDAYEITIIPPNKILSKFGRPPYLLHVANKGG